MKSKLKVRPVKGAWNNQRIEWSSKDIKIKCVHRPKGYSFLLIHKADGLVALNKREMNALFKVMSLVDLNRGFTKQS